MANGEELRHGLTRRGFLKTATAVAGAASAVGLGSGVSLAFATGEDAASPVSEERVFSSFCRGNCMMGCAINAHVRDGKVVRTSAQILPQDYSRICAKGLTLPQRAYSPQRVKYPMRRKEGTVRGAGEWERISWDDAIGEVVSKWKSYTSQYGPDSMIMSVGSGAYGIVNGVPLSGGAGIERLRAVTGAGNMSHPVDRAHGQGLIETVVVDLSMTGNAHTDYVNSKNIICWGANPVVSQPHNMHFIFDAMEKGAKYIVIDPQFNANAAKADWWIPIRPQTDSLLAIGMMKIMVENGWQDKAFLAAHTNSPFLVKEDGTFLRAYELGLTLEDGSFDTSAMVWDLDAQALMPFPQATNPAITDLPEIPGFAVATSYDKLLERLGEYSMDLIVEETTIPEADIRELTRIYTQQGPSQIYLDMGHDHYYQGHTHYQAIYVMAEFAGMLGKPGAGCGSYQVMTNFLLNEAFCYPAGAPGYGRDFLLTHMNEILDTGMFNGEPATIKGLYISHGNLLTSMADRDQVLTWLNKLEFIVCAETHMSEIARYSDIVLPASHWFEETDAYWSYNTHPFVIYGEQAIDPLFDSKPDFEIVKLIAQGLGVGKFYDMTQEEFIANYFNAPFFQMFGISLDSLKAMKVMYGFMPDYIAFADGYFMATEGGRGQIYWERPVVQHTYNDYQSKIDVAAEHLPHYAEAPEIGRSSALRAKYPFHCMSDHDRYRTHSQWFDLDMLMELEPECSAKLNRVDMEALGLKDGDLIKMYNDRGYVVLPVYTNNGIRPGMVHAQKGWQEGQYIDGHFSSLTSSETHPIVCNQAFNEVAVAIEKWEGK